MIFNVLSLNSSLTAALGQRNASQSTRHRPTSSATSEPGPRRRALFTMPPPSNIRTLMKKRMIVMSSRRS